MAITYAPATIRIGDIVDSFILKYRRPMEDYTVMLLHAFDCLRNNMSHLSRLYNSEVITTDANGTLDMPRDMVDFIGIALAGEKTLWFFTKNQKLNAEEVSASGDIESVEPVSGGYAQGGGRNDYYYKLDWNGRKIYTDGAEAADVVLCYVSTGIRTDEETYVDTSLAPVIDAYMYWRLGEIENKSINEIERRTQAYEREIRLAARYKLPPLRDIRDTMLKITQQGPRR